MEAQKPGFLAVGSKELPPPSGDSCSFSLGWRVKVLFLGCWEPRGGDGGGSLVHYTPDLERGAVCTWDSECL